MGVLSVGTVPMAALANGVSDGIQTLAADWSTGAKVTEAEDGKGAAYTGDLTKPVSFDLGSGKYLVPTQVTNQNGDETDVIDAGLTLTYSIPVGGTTTNADGTYNGLYGAAGGAYKIDGKGSLVPVTVSNGYAKVSAEFAASYFAGTLTDGSGNVVHPIAGIYTVTVGGKVSMNFKIVGENDYAGSYAYENGNPDDTSLVYDGNVKTIGLATADGTPIIEANGVDVTYYDSKGDQCESGATLTVPANETGSYSAVIKVNGETKATVNFTVEKFDISKYGQNYSDTTSLGDDSAARADVLEKVVGISTSNFWYKFQVTDVTAPSGAKGFDGSYGEYTVTVAAKTDVNDPYYDANVTGETTVKFSYLNDNIFVDDRLTDPVDLELGLYYGSDEVTSSSVNVNLTEGESFDASKIKVRSADGATVYSGDQLEVTYKDPSGKTIDASGLSKADDGYQVFVRVKPFQDANGRWVGGTEHFIVNVRGNVAYDTNVSFYVDGEVADATEQLAYDGTDLLERVSAKVSNPEGGQFEYGTDFELEAKNEDGEVVDSIVDAGEYTVSIKPLTFELDDTNPTAVYDFTLEVTPCELSGLKNYTYTAATPAGDEWVGYANDAVAWTGSAVEVPGVQYWDDDAEAYVTLDPSLYNVVSIKQGSKVVKEAVDEGFYTVRIALTDEAKSNYSLKDREFTLEVKAYSPFDDVESPAWYASVVNDAKYTNIVNGISGTNMYAPESEISRKDAVCIIFNMAGGDSWDGEGDFAYSENGGWYTGFGDCDGNAYYAKALAWAHNLGIANGSNGSFRPDDRITREELASMLANYAKVTGDYVASDGSALAALPDAGSVSGWATENVAWAVENGVMGNGGSVNAGANITRAEVAAMAVNYAQKF